MEVKCMTVCTSISNQFTLHTIIHTGGQVICFYERVVGIRRGLGVERFRESVINDAACKAPVELPSSPKSHIFVDFVEGRPRWGRAASE